MSARTEQAGIDAQPSALRSRLGKQGQVLPRRATRLTFLERVADEVRIRTVRREVTRWQSRRGQLSTRQRELLIARARRAQRGGARAQWGLAGSRHG